MSTDEIHSTNAGEVKSCRFQKGIIFALDKIGTMLGMDGDYTILDIEKRISDLRKLEGA